MSKIKSKRRMIAEWVRDNQASLRLVSLPVSDWVRNNDATIPEAVAKSITR